MEGGEGLGEDPQHKSDDFSMSSFDFDLLTEGGDGNSWCEQCKKFEKEKEKLKKEYGQQFNTLKKKIISTDLLIKKYKKKCEDYDLLSKELTDANKKAEQYRRESEVLKTQLTSSLTQLEPTRRAHANLESELKIKCREVQDLKDKLSAHEVIQKQYNLLNSSSKNFKQTMESTMKEYNKTIRELELRNQKQETQINKFKEEIKASKTECSAIRRAQQKDASNLKRAMTRMEVYFQILKDNGLLPKGHKRLRMESFLRDSESQEENSQDEDITDMVPPPSFKTETEADNRDEAAVEDEEDSLLSFSWTFSPLVNVLSPLPPSPVPCRNGIMDEDNDSDDSVDAMVDQLENEMLTYSPSRQSPTPKSPQQSSPKPVLQRQGLSRSPRTPTLRERTLVKANKKQMTKVETSSASSVESAGFVTLKKSDTLILFGETETLSDSDEENKAAHSNIIKCEKFVKHENSAFIKFVKASNDSQKQDPLATTNCSDKDKFTEGSSSVISETSNVSAELNDGIQTGRSDSLEKKELQRADTGSFECNETLVENSPTKSKPRETVISTEITEEKANLEERDKHSREEGNRSLTKSSPNRPITRNLTRSLSLSSDSILENDLQNRSPSKRRARSRTNSGVTHSSLPCDNAHSANFHAHQPKPAFKLHKTSDSVVTCNSSVSKDSIDRDKNAPQSNYTAERKVGKIEEIGPSGDGKGISHKSSSPRGAQMVTRSKSLTSAKESLVAEKELPLARSKGRSKIPSGKGKHEVQVENVMDKPICSHLSSESRIDVIALTDINSATDSSLLGRKKRIAHKGKQTEVTKTEAKNDATLNIQKEEVKDIQEVTKSVKEAKVDDSSASVWDSDKKDGINGHTESPDEKRMTRSMTRQCSTGFTLKSLPVLHSDIKFKALHSLGSIVEDDKTEVVEVPLKEESDFVKDSHDVEKKTLNLDGKISEAIKIEEKEVGGVLEDKGATFVANAAMECPASSENNVAKLDSGASSSSCVRDSAFDKQSTAKLESHSVSGVKPSEQVKSNPGPSGSEDVTCTPVYVPSSSSLLKSTLHKTLNSSLTTDVTLSPELSSLSGKSVGQTQSPQSARSISPSSPVSPLPPSPFEFFIPMPISPLPPSPVRNTRPLSPLPGSPALSDGDSLPAMPTLAAMVDIPLSDSTSTDSSPVCTPVTLLTPMAATPKHRKSTLTPPSSGSSHTSATLCSFHSKAPSDAITVRPQNGCLATPTGCKRSLSPSFVEDNKKLPGKQLRSDPQVKDKKKRRSFDAGNHAHTDVSSEKKPCLSDEAWKMSEKSVHKDSTLPCRTENAAKSSTASKQESAEDKAAGISHSNTASTVVNNISISMGVECAMNMFLISQSMDMTEIEQRIVGESDVAMVSSALVNWTVQKLKCNEMEVFSFIVTYCQQSKMAQARTEPFLASGEARLLQLLNYLFQKEEWKQCKQKLLKSLWSAIFLKDVVTQPGRSALCRIFTGIAKFDGNIEQVQVLFYHILTCGYLNGPILAVTIAGVWPKALYREQTGTTPIVMVMEHCLMEKMAQTREKHEKVVLCLMKLCNWSAPMHTTPNLLSHLVRALDEKTANSQDGDKNEAFELHRSLELFISLQKVPFFKVYFTQAALKEMLTKAKRGKKCNKEFVEIILKVAAHFVSTRFQEIGTKYTRQILNKYFIQLLNDRSVSQEVHHIILTTLLDIAYVSPPYILTNGLYAWYTKNKTNIPRQWAERLESVRKVVLSELPNLNCPPFV